MPSLIALAWLLAAGPGLFNVYAVVQQIGGCIEVDSEIGKGSHFKISCQPGARIPRKAQETARFTLLAS